MRCLDLAEPIIQCTKGARNRISAITRRICGKRIKPRFMEFRLGYGKQTRIVFAHGRNLYG